MTCRSGSSTWRRSRPVTASRATRTTSSRCGCLPRPPWKTCSSRSGPSAASPPGPPSSSAPPTRTAPPPSDHPAHPVPARGFGPRRSAVSASWGQPLLPVRAVAPGWLAAGGVGGHVGTDEHEPGFFVREGAVLDTTRDDEQISCVEADVAVLQLDCQLAVEDVEGLLLGLVRVPVRRPCAFGHLEQD